MTSFFRFQTDFQYCNKSALEKFHWQGHVITKCAHFIHFVSTQRIYTQSMLTYIVYWPTTMENYPYSYHKKQKDTAGVLVCSHDESQEHCMGKPESLTPYLRSLKQDLWRNLLKQHESLRWLRWLPKRTSRAVSKHFLSSKLPESLFTVPLISVLNRSCPLTLISNVKLVSSILKCLPLWYLLFSLSILIILQELVLMFVHSTAVSLMKSIYCASVHLNYYGMRTQIFFKQVTSV